MAYDPGTALSDEWRNHFFVTSFPGAPANARIYAFTLKEDGAGFAMDREKVLLRGVLSVGIRIGPDGALYLTDWITGWNSKDSGRLWKLDAPAAAGTTIRKEVQTLLAADFAPRSASDLATLLRHADMRVRQKAQFALARRREVPTLLEAARDTSSLHARLHGLWGLAQLARKDTAHAALLRPFLKDPDGEIRAQAARLIGDVRHAAAGADLLPLLMDTAPRARFFAAEALGRMAYGPATEPLVDMLADNDGHDPTIHHAGSLALASIGDAAALSGLSTHASRAVRLAAVVALRRMQHPGVGRFLADSDEHVATEAARAVNDDGSIPAAVPQLAAMLGTTRFSNEPLLRRAINANLRLGHDAAVQRVAAFAADASASEALRVEAIATLGVWADPSPLDRVDGYYLAPFDVPQGGTSGQSATARATTRGAAGASAALQRLYDTLTAPGAAPVSADVKVAMAQAAGRLGLRSAEAPLRAQLRADPSPEVRVAALEALQALKVSKMDELMQVAFADADATVRRAALGLLPDLSMTSAAKVRHITTVLERGSVTEQQGALDVLGRLESPESRRLLGTYLGTLSAGRLAPELQIDLLDAVRADGAPALQQQLDTYQQARKADSLAGAFREGLAVGGDARRGRQVYAQNPTAECTRCHAIRGQGSDVGPDLTRIGATLSRDQLVEALIAPNARIAPGYGLVGLTLRDGSRVDGTLREETDTHLTLLVGTPPVEQRVAKADIAERTDPVSAMPPLGLVLEPREVRDLVEFLASLR
jgi:putative heme-binding domain-containing protein